jgi:hypothetical protein
VPKASICGSPLPNCDAAFFTVLSFMNMRFYFQ